MKYCQNCGALLEENAKFCQSCGTPVDETPPTPQTAAPAAETATPAAESPSPNVETTASDAQSGTAGEGSASPGAWKQDPWKSSKESRKAGVAVFKKNPLWYIFCCVLLLVIIVVIFVQCSGTSKNQILETAKTFTLDDSGVTLGEAVETNLTNVEWTCYDEDDGFWTVTVSGYNANEDATVSLLIGVTEINDDQVYYDPMYGEVNGNGSMEAADINYAIAIIYDNVGQALVDSLTNYLLGM